MLPRVKLVCHISASSEIRHHEILVAGLDDRLDVRDLMAHQHEEAVPVSTNALVLLDGYGHALVAPVIHALTDERVGRRSVRQDLDPFVHLTKQTLILGGTFAPQLALRRIRHEAPTPSIDRD